MLKKGTLFNKLFSVEYAGGFTLPLLILILFGLLFDFSLSESGAALAVFIIIISIVSLIIGCIFLYLKNKFTTRNIVFLLLISAFFIRLAYAVKTPYTVNQHDIEMLGSTGHLEYIFRLASLKGLPDTNEWQFYNPPLHHITAAVVYKFGELLGFTQDRCFENIQFLSVFWSSCVVAVGYKLLRLLKFKGLPLILTFAVIAYHPTLTLFSGSLNNDPLAFLMITCSLFYTVKWRSSQSFKDVICAGVFGGFAMMTKYSAFFAVFVMLIYIFAKSLLSNRSFTKTVLCFTVPAAVLGLWYQVRNAILFGQNIVYYNEMSTDNLLYIPNGFLSRIFVLPKIERDVFCSVYSDTNIIGYLIKSSVFGEYTFSSETVSGVMLILNIILIVFSIFGLAHIIKRKKSFDRGGVWPFVAVFVTQMIFYLWFNYIQPFGCNMDFRLIPVTMICGVVFAGMLLRDLHIKSRKSKLAFALYIVMTVIIIAFVIFSSLMFI